MGISKGYAITELVTVTSLQVSDFARATGDDNPIHLNPEAAKQAGFSNSVAHGDLVVALANKMLVRRLPGVVLRARELAFKQPVFVGDVVAITATLDQVRAVSGSTIMVWAINYHVGERVCVQSKVKAIVASSAIRQLEESEHV